MKEFGVVVIGDELLSGRRRDKHVEHVIAVFGERGIELSWIRLLADSPGILTREFQNIARMPVVTFSFGGIGATPDDHTRASIAKALNRELVRHPEAVRLIEGRFGKDAYPNRIRMADLPSGCTLIPNPYNQIPGFSLGDLHFLPGFPHMAWPMMEWVLDERYAHLGRTLRQVEFTVYDVPESQLIEFMEDFVADHENLKLSSLPHMEKDRYRIVLGLRGEPKEVQKASKTLIDHLDDMDYHWREGSETDLNSE